ncbi:MAG TPA: histidine kinase [Actinomadura sp.]|nr:histidine kinase [Actinomadura sp.]
MENAHDPRVADPAETNPLPRPVRRLLAAALYAGLALVWLLDLEATEGLRTARYGWFPPLVAGLAAAVLLFLPDRWLSLDRRAWLAGCGSLALTGGMLLDGQDGGGIGLLESVCLLIMLARTCRRVRWPFAAVALGAAVIAAPARMENPGSLSTAFLLTYAVGGAIGLGCYLRVRDGRRARLLEAVRQGERLELARDLHDFVAHHVTGIVWQANAARVIRETAPDQIDPILENIQKAGMETLDSMRRLVRVLREVEGRPRRPGELFTELARLVSDFCSGEEQDATLSVAAPARAARLAPEVETSVHRLVQESLTNVRRHAHGALVAVRVGVEDGRLRVEVRNTPPAASPGARPAAPVGGRGGFGMVGLRERVAAVEGTLETGETPDGGWRVAGIFPVLAVAGSAG